jgi:hypothetical protein
MKTWFATNAQPTAGGQYDVGLALKLNSLEQDGHTIFQVVAISGQVIIISYTE